MKNRKITHKVILLIILMVLVESFADMLIKKSMVQTGIDFTLGNMTIFLSQNLASVLLWIGVILYISTFFIWITALHKVELGIAYPVTSIGYVVVPVLSIIFLKEHIPIIRWIGFFLIIAGIFFIYRSAPHEETC